MRDSGPVSVAVFTGSFIDVVVPVELFAAPVRLVAAFGERVADPAALADPAPVTGTHGVVLDDDGVVAGVVGVEVPDCVPWVPPTDVPAPVVADVPRVPAGCVLCVWVCVVDEVPAVPVVFCAATAPTDNATANAAPLVIIANLFFT